MNRWAKIEILLLFLFAIVSVGCRKDPDGTSGSSPSAESIYLNATDQVLPAGIIGVPYLGSLVVTGGTSPYEWYDVEESIPPGLILATSGEITGIPVAAGDYVLGLVVTDKAGRVSRVQATLQIVLQPELVTCGQHIEGSFLGSAQEIDGPDLADLDNLVWLAVEMPDDLTSRIDLTFSSVALTTLYIERANEIPGSPNISDHYVPFYLNPGYSDMTVTLDAGTLPSLTGYLDQSFLPMLLVAQSAGSWALDIVCSDGPVFVDLEQYPTELGEPLVYDFEVYGDNTGVRIWTEDPLPEWMIWDETTGMVTGTAEAPGAWEFTIIAETEDGRRREEQAIIGVYEVLGIGCGESVPLVVEEGYFDGDFYAFYDPRGFAVYALPLETLGFISQISITVSDSDGHYLGLSGPDPEWLNFYGGAERLYLTEPATIPLDPTVYPSLSDYLDSDEKVLYFSAGTIGLDYELSVSVTCDDSPRPDLAALPVFQPLAAESFSLHALGGTPPYQWFAEGLPNGVTMDVDGTLHGQTGDIGSHTVGITLEDALGASVAGSYPLHVGNDAACAGYTLVQCGDSIEGVFTDAYFNDDNGPNSTAVFCTVEDDQALGFEIYSEDGELRVDVADPGRSAAEMFGATFGTYLSWVERGATEGIGIDTYSWPSLDDYEDLPVLMSIRAYEPGAWTVHLVCQ